MLTTKTKFIQIICGYIIKTYDLLLMILPSVKDSDDVLITMAQVQLLHCFIIYKKEMTLKMLLIIKQCNAVLAKNNS